MATRSRSRPRGLRHRARLATLAGLACVTAGATSRAAGGDGPAINLEWAAPAECPPREAVVAEVTRILGPTVTPNPKVFARASVEHAGASTWKGVVTILTEDGSSLRSFVGSSCDAVAATVSLIVAIAIGPAPQEAPSQTLRTAPPLTAPAPSPPPPTPAASPRTSPTAPAPAPATPTSTAARSADRGSEPTTRAGSARESHLSAAAFAALDLGSLPSPALGALLTIGWLGEVGPGRLRVEAEAGAWATQTARLSSDPNEGAQLSLLTFGARACYALVRGHFELGSCVGVEVDRLEANGFSTQKALDGYGLWGSPRAGLVASWAASRAIAVRLGADVGIAVSPPQFVVETSSSSGSLPLFHPAPESGRGAIGLEVHFF